MELNKKGSQSPDAYRERDEAILRFVGTYGIGLIEAINRVIGQGKQLGHVVRRLADEGLLQLHARALEGGVSYCRLTEPGAARVRMPKDRASNTIGAQALDKAIAVATWCCLTDERRYKVERGEIDELFPDTQQPTNQVHCVAKIRDSSIVYRIQLVQGSHEPVIKAIQRDMDSASPSVRTAIESQCFGFALLVDFEAKKKSLESAITRSGLRDYAAVRVDQSATAKTIAAFLRRLRSGTTKATSRRD